MEKQYCIYCMAPIQSKNEACPQCGSLQQIKVPYHHLAPGTILNGRYLIGTALGEGGFGITYIGRDLTLNRRIAVKEYFPSGFATRNNTIGDQVMEISQSPTSAYQRGCDKFLEEAKIIAGFSDIPNIVSIYDFFRENDTAYIVMEYLTGESLKKYLDHHGIIPYLDIPGWFLPLIKALSLVHQAGVIHRDISPDNIILMPNNTLKLIDFGAAREVVDSKSLSVVLKPGFAPIEQYSTVGNQGPWTDIYALSSTIYKCVTGITPPEATDRVVQDTLRAPSALGISLPPMFEAVLLKGLSIRAANRFQTMEALSDALQNPATFDFPAPPSEKKHAGGKPMMFKQKKGILLAGAGVLAALVILLILLALPKGTSYPAIPDNQEMVSLALADVAPAGTVLSYEIQSSEIDPLYDTFHANCELLLDLDGETTVETFTLVFELSESGDQWQCTDVISMK